MKNGLMLASDLPNIIIFDFIMSTIIFLMIYGGLYIQYGFGMNGYRLIIKETKFIALANNTHKFSKKATI